MLNDAKHPPTILSPRLLLSPRRVYSKLGDFSILCTYPPLPFTFPFPFPFRFRFRFRFPFPFPWCLFVGSAEADWIIE